jgi:predicted nucleotidyltransferase
MEHTLSLLQQDVLRTFAYFDVFSYPLSQHQVYSFLPHNSVTLQHLEKTLQCLVEFGLLKFEDGYYFFSDRTPEIVKSRLENEHRASTMLKRARWISLFLKQIPFVRAVFITGSLSKNVASASSDVDFMIVTAPNRLWIPKMILTAVRRMLLFNSIKYFCFNLFVTENGLLFSEKNIFNAVEIATTRVIWNETAYRRFQSVNSWIQLYLPNWGDTGSPVRSLSNTPSFFQKAAEFVLNLFPLTSVDTFFMNLARSYWKKRNAHLDENKFNSLFQCAPHISSVWYDDHQTRILNTYQRRLAQFGVGRTE